MFDGKICSDGPGYYLDSNDTRLQVLLDEIKSGDSIKLEIQQYECSMSGGGISFPGDAIKSLGHSVIIDGTVRCTLATTKNTICLREGIKIGEHSLQHGATMKFDIK